MKQIVILATVILTGCAITQDPRCGGDHRCNYLISQGYQPRPNEISINSRPITRTIESQWGVPTGRTWETQ